ncbi:MAG: hypothetical protein AAF533_02150 [Acidobacteriota bacterium]
MSRRLLLPLVLLLGCYLSAQAGSWYVEQEDLSDPERPFVYLGCIQTYETPAPNITSYYSYSMTTASYTGPAPPFGPTVEADLTQLFFVEDGTGEVNLVLLHDAVGDFDGSGGGGPFAASSRVSLNSNLPLVLATGDDPTSDTYAPSFGIPSVTHLALHRWAPCCTDGSAYSGVTAMHEIIVGYEIIPPGIDAWRMSSADGAHLDLNRTNGVRIRLTAVPEGASCDGDCDAFGFEGGDDDGGLADVVFPNAPFSVFGSPGPAILFDSENPSCEDDDLRTPGIGTANTMPRGQVLITQELGSDCRPDDERSGSVIQIVYDEDHDFRSVGILDGDERRSFVATYDADGSELCEIEIPQLDDNSWQRVECPSTGVRMVEIRLNGSGAVTDIDCSLTAPVAGPGAGGLLTRGAPGSDTLSAGSGAAHSAKGGRSALDSRLYELPDVRSSARRQSP